MSNNGTERRKQMQEEKASGKMSNYPEVELFQIHCFLALGHIITFAVLSSAIHCMSAPLTKYNKNQIPLASLHIVYVHDQ